MMMMMMMKTMPMTMMMMMLNTRFMTIVDSVLLGWGKQGW